MSIQCIRCWDANPRPLEHDSPPITTRPGLPPYAHNFIYESWQLMPIATFYSIGPSGILYLFDTNFKLGESPIPLCLKIGKFNVNCIFKNFVEFGFFLLQVTIERKRYYYLYVGKGLTTECGIFTIGYISHFNIFNSPFFHSVEISIFLGGAQFDKIYVLNLSLQFL